MTTVGRVAQVWVFPVKSMQGVRLDRAEVQGGGLRGDRAWAVVEADGTPVTAAQEPRLRAAVPRLDGDNLTLDVPGERPGLKPDEAGAALSRWLGRPLRLERRDVGGFVEVAPVHLVSTGSIEEGPAAEHGDTCDTEPRANLILDLDAPGPVERSWLGSQVALGSARLHVVRHPKNCLGTYADVIEGGTVSAGDEVAVVVG